VRVRDERPDAVPGELQRVPAGDDDGNERRVFRVPALIHGYEALIDHGNRIS